MEDFPSNSHNVLGPRAKEEPPKKDIQKVVSGEVIQRPKGLGRKFRELFTGNESRNAFRYVIADVLLPAFKNMVVDATSKGMERMVYGDSGPRRGRTEYRPRVSYNQPIDRYPNRALSRATSLPDQPPHRPGQRRRDAGEIILISREEAELVLERLNDIVDKYDVASVADLHELVGLQTTYVDNKWGWTSLAYSNIQQIREGYLLDLPPVEAI